MIEKKKETEEDKAYLLTWINGLVKPKYIQITSLQQLSNGVVFCELLNLFYPGKIPLSKVFIKPKTQFEVLQNFKLLSYAFQKLNMKTIDPHRLIKGKYSDMITLLLYIKRMIEEKQKDGECASFDCSSMQTSLIFFKSGTPKSLTKSSKGFSGARQRISVSPPSRPYISVQKRPPKSLNGLEKQIQFLTNRKQRLLCKISEVLKICQSDQVQLSILKSRCIQILQSQIK